MNGFERKGWSMTWLVLVAAVLVALPAMITSQLIVIPILCLFFAGLGLARRRFTPAIATLAVATLTISISPLGEAMVDPRSYDPYEAFTYPADLRQAIEERASRGEPMDSKLFGKMRYVGIPAGTDVNYGIYVLVALVGLAYLTVAMGAVLGIRRARRQ